MNAIETLISVLCGPEGKCCISGSDDDRRLIDSALAELAQAAQAAQADSVTAPAVHSQTYEMLLKAAGTALEVLQKHRQMKGDWPVGELGRRAAEELQAARDASFNADREDPAQLADSVQEDAARYRWLRDQAHPDSEDSGIAVSESDFNDWGNKFTRYYSGEELDAAIDAARAADSGVQDDAARESEYRRGYRHGYEQRDAEVRGAMA